MTFPTHTHLVPRLHTVFPSIPCSNMLAACRACHPTPSDAKVHSCLLYIIVSRPRPVPADLSSYIRTDKPLEVIALYFYCITPVVLYTCNAHASAVRTKWICIGH